MQATLLTIAYDGTNYAGWQRQNNAITVQQKIEEALAIILGQSTSIKGASRTDAGVHALGQRAVFATDKLKIPLSKLPKVINSFLPTDIAVKYAKTVGLDFNPRFGATYKTYHYNIYNSPTPCPINSRFSAYIDRPLDITTMEEAAKHFVGRHDFAAFMATGSNAKTTTREIYHCNIAETSKNLITLQITGNAFLYNMVRIIAGTVAYVGMGKISPQDIPSIIAQKNRKNAGKTMPAEGLTLINVEYSGQIPINMINSVR